MKKGILFLAFICCLTLLGQTVGKAQSELDFVFENGSGITVDRLYVSSTESEVWEEDILGRDTLDDDEHTRVRFSPQETHRYWDIKVVTSDGEEHIFQQGYDLSRIYKIRFEESDDTYSLRFWYR